MNTATLQEELRAAGLITLAVSRHPIDPFVATVYLHGAKGQWVDGYAANLISQIPGVRRVCESVRTPAILLVWMEAT
jgi:hypothetical protein